MNWRTYGDSTLEAFADSLPVASQIKKRHEVEAVYEAASPHTRLFRGMLEAESSGATNFNAVPPSYNNPVNMRIRGQEPFQQFNSIAECAAEWKSRLTSATYAYKDTITIEDLLGVYAPASDNNDEEQYAATVKRVIASLKPQSSGGTPVTGLTPWPNRRSRPLPDKFGAGMSYAHRKPFVGSWWHTMIGWLDSTDAYFRQSSVGAATDYGIGGQGDGDHDGWIYQWIDYQQRMNATPWASGWDNAPDYDDQGQAYVNAFGVRGVNSGGISIEFSGLVATPVSAKQWEAGIHLTAAIHHRDLGQGWEEFAWNMHHREVAEKDCPFPRIYNYTKEYQAAIVLVMRHFETGYDIPDTVTIAGKQVRLPGGAEDGVIIPPANPLYIAFVGGKSYAFHTVARARSRKWGNTDAPIVRTYPNNTAVRATGWYVGQEIDGDDRWLLLKSTGPSNGARMHASVVKEAFTAAGIVR